MNYTELTQAIQDYTENTETNFVSNIPTFIRQAEEKILRQVLIPELRKASTGATVANSEFLARPSDMLAVYSIAIQDSNSNWKYLVNKNVTFLKEAFPDSLAGLPKYYAQFVGGTTTTPGYFILGPKPNAVFNVQINYYYEPPSIVTAGTTWLGDNAETALLYGALLEAYTFMKGDADLMAQYREQHKLAMDSFRKIGGLLQQDGYRHGEESYTSEGARS
tara:strand:- start:9429 stop:10088 length:660 start_codon:yes stop_codon:yes gene_type:complete